MGDNKKSNTKLIGGIIAVVAVLVIGICVFAFGGQNKAAFKKLTGTPEEIVAAAISNTNSKSLQEQADMNAKLGATKVSEIREKEASEVSFNLGFKGISGLEEADIVSAYLKDAGLKGSFKTTKDGNKLNGNLQVMQSELELLGASIYKENDEVGISIPKILDATYAIKLNSFLEDYKNSDLYTLMGGQEINEEEFKEVTEIFDAFGKYMTGAMSLSSNKEFISQTEALQVELIKEAQVKENGKTPVTLSDGSETEWTVYSGTLTGQQLVDFFNKEMELMMSLDFAKDYFDVLAKYSGYTVEEMLEEMKATLETDETVTADIDFFVDDTYFRGINLGLNENEVSICNFTIQYIGSECLVDGITFNFNVEEDGEQVAAEMSFNQNLGEKADLFTQGLNVTLVENGETLGTIDYGYSYDAKATENNLSVNMGLDFGSEAKMKYTATGTKVVSNEEVSTNLDAATLNVESAGEGFTLDFSLGYGIKAIKASDITIDKTDVKYVFEMTTEELMNAMQTIQTNIQSFAYGLL